MSALIETLNNPRVGNATESSFLGPYFTEDAPNRSSRPISSIYLGTQPVPPSLPLYIYHTVSIGGSIASEGKGEYMYVEGRVLTTSGEPIPGAVIDTWEADSTGEQSFEVRQFPFPPA